MKRWNDHQNPDHAPSRINPSGPANPLYLASTPYYRHINITAQAMEKHSEKSPFDILK
ncbi:hypothetical protein [Burkholderia sp. TSV86]|uniref:hypothetical protein n=1 Tax=Burkholderia sp. TSV86 TaxID=1385594 RepID=UPI0012E36699|nr:hypothetical protein [Burkholderia sp. TSV86]